MLRGNIVNEARGGIEDTQKPAGLKPYLDSMSDEVNKTKLPRMRGAHSGTSANALRLLSQCYDLPVQPEYRMRRRREVESGSFVDKYCEGGAGREEKALHSSFNVA